MKEIGIICLLPEETDHYCQALRSKIAAEFGLDTNLSVPAHITLKYHFPVQDIDAIERVAHDFCLSQAKTSWTLYGFNYFMNANQYVIFIDVIPSSETRQAHASFLDKLRKINWVEWGQFDNANLHYHVTLAAQGITSENFEGIWSFVNEQENPNFDLFFR